MKNVVFGYRIISSLWLGALFFLFMMPQTTFYPHINTTYFKFLFIIAPIVGMMVGYFWGFKLFFLPAGKLYHFPLRCVAGVWAGAGVCLLAVGIKLNSLTEYILIGIPGFILGFFIIYKILRWPEINYIKDFPSVGERISSTLYFGFFGYLVSWPFLLHQDANVNLFFGFISLLSAYIGFYHGYRILLLPNSFKAFNKAFMLGFIGASYILMIFLLEFSLGFGIGHIFAPQDVRVVDLFTVNFVLMFAIFPGIGIFISMIGGVISAVFYLLSRFWVDVRPIGQSG